MAKRRKPQTDLTGTVRAIIQHRIDVEFAGVTLRACEAWGVPQSTLAGFLRGDQGLRLDTLGLILDALEMTPLEFLELDPSLESDELGRILDDRDHAWQRFRRLLPASHAMRVMRTVERSIKLGIAEAVQARVQDMLATAEAMERTQKRRRNK